jgi:hypothetical protein
MPGVSMDKVQERKASRYLFVFGFVGLVVEFTFLRFVEFPSLRADIVNDVLLSEAAVVGFTYGAVFVAASLMYLGYPRTESPWFRPLTLKTTRRLRRLLWAWGVGYPILSLVTILYSVLFYQALLIDNVSFVVHTFPMFGLLVTSFLAALPTRGTPMPTN